MAEEQTNELANLKKVERAAILLMTLGEDEAAEVLKYMGAKEVQKLGAAMATLGGVSREQAGQVLDAFITDVEDSSPFGVGTEEYVRKVLSNAFGAAKANAFIDRILSGDDGSVQGIGWRASLPRRAKYKIRFTIDGLIGKSAKLVSDELEFSIAPGR